MTSDDLRKKIEWGTATLEDAKKWACASIDAMAPELDSQGFSPQGLCLFWVGLKPREENPTSTQPSEPEFETAFAFRSARVMGLQALEFGTIAAMHSLARQAEEEGRKLTEEEVGEFFASNTSRILTQFAHAI